MHASNAHIKDWLTREAKALGFDACRVARADGVWRDRLEAWLAAGHHGGMDWMAEKKDRRASPAALWPEARSAIMLGLNYGPESDPLATLADPEVGTISVYARGRDYHGVIKGRLKQLAQKLAARASGKVKVFVDTAPLMEKPLAEAAGLGWQGKHTVLVSRELGNWLFLGVILTTVDIAPDTPESDHCGSCSRCLTACPTDAFPAPYLLDSRRCISYLTIEHAGHIDRELRPLMGNRIYGCDDCLAVCPWNKFAVTGREAKLQAREDLNAPPLAELLTLDEAAFRKLFASSPIKRTGRDRFMRNVLIAAGNVQPSASVPSPRMRGEGQDEGPGEVALRELTLPLTPTLSPHAGRGSLATAILPHLADLNPIVRAAAVWALRRLDPESAFAMKPDALSRETDPDVAAEWTLP